jgi:hypothetical protein
LNTENIPEKRVSSGGVAKQADNKETEIRIINISRNGVGFIMTNPLEVSVGETLHIAFIFKDTKRSLVSKKIIVRRIENDLIGAEFEKPSMKRTGNWHFS